MLSTNMKNPRNLINFYVSKEWHPTKNGELTPYDVTTGSRKKVWWQCQKNHEWEASISKRVNGTGCPCCSGQKVSSDNNLAAKNESLAREWHPTKNGDLTPYDVTAGSNKKMWWQCENNHEWQAIVSSRNKGYGCPCCSGQKACSDNNLALKNESLAREWHPTRNDELTPYDVSAGSRKKVWWQCENNHEWEATVCNRNKGRGCPYCSCRKACIDNNLAAKNESIAREWHPVKNGKLTPHDVTAGSQKKVWWQCENNHEWEATVFNRNKGTGCPKCLLCGTSKLELRVFCEMKKVWGNVSSRKIINGFEIDVYIEDYDVGIEIDGGYWHKNKFASDLAKNEAMKSCGVNLVRLRDISLLSLGEIENTIYYDLSNIKVSVLISLCVLVVDSIHADKRNFAKSIWNICEKKYTKTNSFLAEADYKEAISSISLPEPDKSLAALYPDIALEWSHKKNYPLTAKQFSAGSNYKAWWQCENNHEWEATVCKRNKGSGCPCCSGQKVCSDNNLAAKNELLARDWHPTKNGVLTPYDVTADSNKKIWWQCENNHEWEAIVSSRNRGSGCPICRK